MQTASFVARTYHVLHRLKTAQTTPRRAGEEIAQEVCRMGPLYTKMAQFISARRDSIDAEFADALSLVQDRVPPGVCLTPPEVQGYIVESVPFASASVADVYRARRTADGAEVVIKKRRPGVKERIMEDLPLLKTVMDIAAVGKVPGAKNMADLISETQDMVLGEMDFSREALACRSFKDLFGHVSWLVIPEVLLADEDTLISVYQPAKKLDMVVTPNPPLATRLMDLYMMMLQAGKIHADPHPGNIGYLSGGRIVLYDFGAMVTVDASFGDAMARVLHAGITKNADGVMTALEDLGAIRVEPGNRPSVRRLVRQLLSGADLHQKLSASPEFTDGDKRIVRLGTEFIYLVRTLALIEGTCKVLDPDFSYDYAAWVPENDGMLDALRDVASLPSAVLTMQSDMEEFQTRVFAEVDSMKSRAAFAAGVIFPIIFLALTS